MGGRSQISLGLRAMILAIVLISSGLSRAGPPKADKADGISLIIKQFPTQGGTITPGLGVHHFNLDEEIALTAVPKSGYKFVRWIGDVSDPKDSRTFMQIKEPKIIIALFERSEYDGVFPRAGSPGGGARSGVGRIADVGNFSSLTAGGSGKVVLPSFVSPSSSTKSDLPLTELPNVIVPAPELPVVIVPASDEPVVPEPATGTLLIFGSMFALKWLNGNRLNSKSKY
jgi:hypothetical protein